MKFGPARWFFTLEICFFQLQQTLILGIFYKFLSSWIRICIKEHLDPNLY